MHGPAVIVERLFGAIGGITGFSFRKKKKNQILFLFDFYLKQTAFQIMI
jgi:hypothetical protein